MGVSYGEWASLDAATTSGEVIHGSSKFWVEIAKVGLNQVKASSRTIPVWVDVTDKVAGVTYSAGGLGGADESRWPPATAQVLFRDLQDVSGMDFIDVANPNSRLAAGSLIRFGMTGTRHTAMFTGFIDELVEDDLPDFGINGPRLCTAICFDTLWWLAGRGYSAVVAFTELDNAITNVLTQCKWPFTLSVAATTIQSGANSSGETLETLHRLADSYGHTVFAAPWGAFYTWPWGGGYPSPALPTLSDMPKKVVSGHTTLTNGVTARARWSSSAKYINVQLLSRGAAGFDLYDPAVPDARILGKFPGRINSGGWPKQDLLTRTDADLANVTDGHYVRFDDELQLVSLEIDTLRDSNAWAFIAGSSSVDYMRLGVVCTYQRRRFGSSGWIEKTLLIVGLDVTITPAADGQSGRIQAIVNVKDVS